MPFNLAIYAGNGKFNVQSVFLCNRLSVPIPSVSTSASSYGAFMGLSGNLRYQLLNGAERVMQDHFQHLGVVIFFSAALRYFLQTCSRQELVGVLIGFSSF
jgi:hypothetical protein